MCNIAVEICEQIVLSSTRASKMCLCMCLTERHGAHVYYIRCSYVLELYVLHGDYSNKHKLGKRMCCGGACKVYSSPKYENQYLLISMPFQTGMTFFHLWCSEKHQLRVFCFMRNAGMRFGRRKAVIQILNGMTGV